VIINEAFARKYWPKQDALGQRITIGKGLGPEFEDPTREVVGIIRDLRERGLDNDVPPLMYVPQAQVRDALTAFTSKIVPIAWVVRTAADPLTLVGSIRREVTGVDSQQAVFEFRSMEQVLEKSMATRRFILLLLCLFAGIALLLAAIGIYGVMAYDVEQRTHEIGIRMALGADRGDVVSLVIRHGMTLAGIGVAIGLVAAFGVTRVLSALLFGVKATDPLTFGGVAAVLTGVALVAVWIPAHRATRVDPMTALR
jgi:putative ABC transport system permease protein